MHQQAYRQAHQQAHHSPVEGEVAVSVGGLGVVPQADAVVLNEVVGLRRRGLEARDPRQHRQQAQKGGVHLREKLSVEPIAVDLAQCPILPSEDLVDLPTDLLERTHHYNPHHRDTHSHQLAMLLRLARTRHIFHNYLDPREWALCQ